MFCPKCGQQQISETTRFCSHCGLAISGVTELLARSEGIPKKTVRARLASAKKEIQLGAKLMFFSVVLAPVFLGLSIEFDTPVPLYVPLATFLVGSVLILYAQLFGEETSPSKSQQSPPPELGPISSANTLPPAHSVGISETIGQRVNTAEMVQPPSVTDRTTKLLDIDSPKNE